MSQISESGEVRTETQYRVIKRHADDYIAIDYPGLSNWDEVIKGMQYHSLADGESLTIVREQRPNAHPARYWAYDRAVGRNPHYM